MRIEIEEAKDLGATAGDRETEQGVKSSGWSSELPAVNGWYWSRRSGPRQVLCVRDGAVAYGSLWMHPKYNPSFFEGREFLGPLSPSDTEELFKLREEVETQKRLLKVSQDLLIDVLDSRAILRFSTIGQSRMKSHVEDLRELLNPKD